MTEQTDTQQGIATAIIVDSGKTLMIRRREREGKLLWAFPGGGIEAGETPGTGLPFSCITRAMSPMANTSG